MTDSNEEKKSRDSTASELTCLLSAEAMQELGFKARMPGGNPTEPWWSDEGGVGGKQNISTFFGLPSRNEFWAEISEHFREQGRSEVRDLLNKALGR